MISIITSQHYLDDQVIVAKLTEADFGVLVSPVFHIDGRDFRVILDGNHSFAAALEAGVDPDLMVADASQHDAVGLLDQGKVEDFLQALWMDGHYVDATTRTAAF